MARILVVDDDLAIREMVALALEKRGHRVERADGFAAALRALREPWPDLILSDIYMPGGSGLDLLQRIREQAEPLPLILMTAKGSVETAASALRDGVFDYLAKPFDLDLMLERVQAALRIHPPAPSPEVEGPESLIIGAHPAIVEVYKAVARVAPLPVPVLVLGETGTGKELVAQALHRHGACPQGPFVPVHCGAIPDTLIESELFGHKKGAFTDAQRDRRGALVQAHGGTVFLDEVGDITPMFQVKLLRFLEDGLVLPLGAERAEPVAVRVVAATHRDLKALVTDGRFREDLYYRLAGYEIRIPPLRERLSDLGTLVAHFQQRYRLEFGLPERGQVAPEVLSLLAAHPWPGNIRELSHILRRALIEAGSLEDAGTIQRLLGTSPIPSERKDGPLSPAHFAEPFVPLEAMERMYLLAVLAHTGGNKTEAAAILGIERKTLARKLRRTEGGEVDDPEGGEP
ncbi:MAG: sigma-54-dependent Fis family transcriptional regulator [Acidobacteria bacterium]|nr:sigma-54-dependent Fis family transcriptional regulator [Acidobacteriota bacterium]MBI3488333.1 sigma-54-dependent Fis family transcriptional regulator [Acidobacteriota bacterium]